MRILSPRSGISNTFSFEKFVHPSKRIVVEEQGRETPFDTSIRSSPFYLPALARNTRSIPSIGFRTRFRATITNVLLHEFLSTQPWEHLAAHPWYSLLASNAKLEKVCGRDWTARLHPTGRSVRASGISFPSTVFLDANRCCRISLIAAR